MKTCYMCKTSKEESAFHVDRSRSTGLSSKCKVCMASYLKQNKYKYHYKRTVVDRILREHRYPWLRFYCNIKKRCKNPKCASYPYYGGKGVLMLISLKEIKALWYRDRGWELKHPEICRINETDPDKWHYTFENCQFLDRSQNKRGRKPKPNAIP